jgi:hypothetical protein
MDTRALGAAMVLDPDGTQVRLAAEWADHPAVIVWLRHFGCVFCREQVAEIRGKRADIEALGGGIVFVGNGTARAAGWFQKKFAADSVVLTDPELLTYKAIGARSGVLSTLGPSAWGAGLRAFRSGSRQSTTKGDAFQQGGLVVMAPGNRVVYQHISRAAGDHAPVADVLAALETAASTSAA